MILMADDHLAEVLTSFIVTEGLYDVIKWKHAIDDRPEPVYGNGAVHGDELGPITCKHHPNCGGRAVKDVHVNRRRFIGQAADEIDLSIERHRLNGAFERAA